MSLHTLMFGWEYPPAHEGGLGIACQGIVRGLLHHGARVTLVLPHDEGVEDGVNVVYPTEEQRRISVMKIDSSLQPYDSFSAFTKRQVDVTKISSGLNELYGRDLGEEVERFTSLAVDLTKDTNPDIVHTHDWMTIEAGRRAANYHRKPLVAHVHATELDRTEFNPHPWIFERELAGLRAADHVLAVSQYTKTLLTKEYGIPADKITVLHNGTFDRPSFPAFEVPNQKHPLVLFLGRLTVQKGAVYFLKAAEEISRIRPDVRFVVAGEGYLLPELVERSIAMGLADRMIFAGKVSTKEAKSLYSRASCFVMPSVSEPFGLVALEAITHGAPVIMSKQSGASEVIHNSMTVDFWDTNKMADCILTVLREEPLRNQMRIETPRILSNLTWQNQAGKILNIYKNIIES